MKRIIVLIFLIVTASPPVNSEEVGQSNIKTGDFQLFLSGTLSCNYQIKSNGIITKEATFPCDSSVIIKVGANGDCRNEGKDTCEIISDGGYFGRGKRHVFSIKFSEITKTSGRCEEYSSFNCIEESSCLESGGTPISGYCASGKCCIQQSTDVESGDTFLFDKSKDSVISDASINNQLNLIKQKHNAKIILEIVDDVPPDTQKNLHDKFNFLYKLEDEKGFAMVITYGINKNIWRGMTFSDCKLSGDTLKKIISEDLVSKNIEVREYNDAFGNFVKLMEAAVAKKAESGNICQESTDIKDCQKECNSSFLGLNGCSMEKCVNMDECIWNSQNGGGCENICSRTKSSEVVVIKKNDCSNAKNCGDTYLCRNGNVLGSYPIKTAYSKVGITNVEESSASDNQGNNNIDIIVSCPGLRGNEAVFVNGYNTYSSFIKNAADVIRDRVQAPEALIAAVISQESAWNPKAVSRCASGGVAQFVPATGRNYGLRVPVYEFREIGECNKANCGGKIPSACNACMPSACRYDEDERFDPEKSIDVMAKHISDLLNQCGGNLESSIKAYNSGKCGVEANAGYYSKIAGYYSVWKGCLGSQGSIEADSAEQDDIVTETAGETETFEMEPGIYNILEKIEIDDSVAGKRYTESEGNVIRPGCDISHAEIKDYWMTVKKGETCIGLHGSDMQTSCSSVDNSKVGHLFNSVSVGTSVTIRETGSAKCSGVCSGMIEGIEKIIDSSRCETRCNQLGCGWDNGKCSMSSCSSEAVQNGKIIFDIVALDLFGGDAA